MKRLPIIFSFSIIVIVCFTTCKKYPENTLWFKNPKTIAFITGNMTHYIVNGVDSISYLDNYFYNDGNNVPYSHPFNDLKFISLAAKDKGHYELTIEYPSDYFFPNNIKGGNYSYKEKGKKIKMSGTSQMLLGFKKNIFVSDDIEWEIIYLSKKNNKRKINGTYNGNTYEIQFN